MTHRGRGSVYVLLTIYILLSAMLPIAAHFALRRLGVSRGLPLYVWLIAAFACALGVMESNFERREAQQRMIARVSGLGPTYAEELRRMGHASIGLDTPPDDPVYLQIIDAQKKWLQINRLVADIYTYRIIDGKWVLLVDSETDYDHNGVLEGDREQRTEIGEVIGPAEGLEAVPFWGRPVFDAEVYSDRWGTWVSAYAPIYDDEGRVEAAVGVDYPAKDWVYEQLMAATTPLGLMLFVSLMLVSLSGALRARGASLEQAHVHERTLEEARRAAEAANAAKSAFLANISHEIRTPMNAIIGFAEILSESDAGPAVRAHADIIARNGKHLIALINDLLDLSKIEAGAFQIDPVPTCLPALIADTCDLLGIRAESKGIELSWEAGSLPEWVMADPTRVRQILTNLVGNAIKFTEHGSVRVEVMTRGDLIEVRVHDSGIGIPRDRLAAIFLPFEQAELSTTRRFGGTGLGLSISRKLAHLMGGDVTVESELGVGSVFAATFVAPATQAPAQAPDQTRGSVDALEGCRVLYAEDGPDNQRLIRHHLERSGMVVELADDGCLAIERYHRMLADGERLDLILTDVQMPHMDGLEMARRLRREGCQVPIIALSAAGSKSDAAECVEAGCNGFLCKPVRKEELLKLCAHHLQTRRRSAA